MFGFLNVYKPKGITSFDVVKRLRRVLKIKQIGHTGTLDPLAEGVLPICIGKSTKLIDYLQEDKGYIASIKFGYVSDTFDTEGNVQKSSDKKISADELCKILKTFEGEIEQTPPIYSAIKLNGKKLYEYARSGKGDDIEIPKRKVNISKIELLEFNEAEQNAKINVECSKGTYIRSIVNDLGQKTTTGAVMTNLIRTKSGKFTIADAIDLEALCDIETIVNNLINPLKVLSYNSIELNENEYKKVVTGQKIPSTQGKEGEIILLTKDNKLISIAKIMDSTIKVIKVFV